MDITFVGQDPSLRAHNIAAQTESKQENASASTVNTLHEIVSGTQKSASTVPATVPPTFPAVVTATLTELSDDGPLVTLHDGEQRLARTTVALTAKSIGRSVVLVFENGDANLPIIMGAIAAQPSPLPVLMEESSPVVGEDTTAHVDGERVVLEGRKEIVLKCGKASITLTRAGKVLIQGAYVSSRSSGVQRIRGGSVHIN